MTILLYDHIELQERASKHLKGWKACHLVLYALAAVFGVMNFVFIQNTMQLVDENCVLFPRKLEFHVIELPLPLETLDATDDLDSAQNFNNVNATDDLNSAQKSNNVTENAQELDTVPANDTSGDADKVKRETTGDDAAVTENDGNVTVFLGFESMGGKILCLIFVGQFATIAFCKNSTHRLMLDTSRTLFETDSSCQFAEFMPIMSTIFAAMWLTMFTMCPGGGHARSGLQQPWRILMPALLFSLVMVGLTGHSFTSTNKGLHDFCEAFSQVTNTTTCSAVNPYLERGWNASWSFGGRVSATRAASAGVWAAWACAAALLLARCLAAPDFVVKRTGVYLTKDPKQKIIPHLRLKSPKSHRSSQSSPTKRDTVSVRSEPTAITELVSASVEPGHDSAPSSLMSTPLRTPKNTDAIEMTYNPQERFLQQP